MRQIDQDGALLGNMQLLIQAGFQANDTVRRKADGVVATLLSAEGDNALISVNGERASVPVAGFLKGAWNKYKIPEQAHLIRQIPNPLLSDIFNIFEMKNTISLALNDTFTKFMHNLSKVYVSTTPNQNLFSAGKFNPDQLCIAPVTTRIEHKLDEPGADAWVVQTPHEHCHYTLGKMPISESAGVVVPFWIVKTTSNEADANLKVCMHKCKGGIQIPVLKNSVAVCADTKLMLYKPREVKADAIIMARADAGEDAKAKAKPKRGASCSAPAAKRVKK